MICGPGTQPRSQNEGSLGAWPGLRAGDTVVEPPPCRLAGFRRFRCDSRVSRYDSRVTASAAGATGLLDVSAAQDFSYVASSRHRQSASRRLSTSLVLISLGPLTRQRVNTAPRFFSLVRCRSSSSNALIRLSAQPTNCSVLLLTSSCFSTRVVGSPPPDPHRIDPASAELPRLRIG